MAASFPLSPAFYCNWCDAELLDQQAVKNHQCPHQQSQSSKIISVHCTCCGLSYFSRGVLALHANVRGFRQRPGSFPYRPRHIPVVRVVTTAAPLVHQPVTPVSAASAPLDTSDLTLSSPSVIQDTQLSTLHNILSPTPEISSSPIIQPPLSPILNPDPLLSIAATIDESLSDYFLSDTSTLHPLTQQTPPAPTSPLPACLTLTAPTTSTSLSPVGAGQRSLSLTQQLYNELQTERRQNHLNQQAIRSLALHTLLYANTLNEQTTLQPYAAHDHFVHLLQTSSVWPASLSTGTPDLQTVLSEVIPMLYSMVNASDPLPLQ